MKKLITLTALLALILCGVKAETKVVSWKVGSTGPAVGTAFQVNDGTEDVLQIAFGAMNTSKDDKNATNYTTGDAGTNVTYKTKEYSFDKFASTSKTNGSDANNLAADGSSQANYMAFVPKYDGTLIIVVQNSGGKTTYLYEDGVAKSATLIGTGSSNVAFNGEGDLYPLNNNSNYSGGVLLTVKAGSTYTISVGASKGRWQGAIYEFESDPSDTRADATLAFATTSGSITFGEAFELPALTKTPAEMAVTYSSSNTSVATIGSDGKVTVLAPGETTFTASFEGDTNYKPTSATFTLTVIPTEVSAVSSYFWKADKWNTGDYTANTINDNLEVIATSDKKVTVDNASTSISGESFTRRIKLGGTGSASTRHIHFKVSGSCTITIYFQHSSGSGADRIMKLDAGSFGSTVHSQSVVANAKTTLQYVYVGGEQDFYAYSASSGLNVFGIKVEPLPATTNVTVGEDGYRTFASKYPLDFTEPITGLKAYKATVSGSTVTFSEVTGKVPAKGGLLLKAAQGVYTIPVSADEPAEFNNALVGVTAETPMTEQIFVLLNGNKGIGFYKTGDNFTVSANTAYLPASVAGARQFIGFDEEGEATGIEAIERVQTTDTFFNLNGQRVAQPSKGLYIVNGKKVVLK